MAVRVYVSHLGEACLPAKYAGAVTGNIRLFSPHKDSFNQMLRYLKNGGSIVLTGDWGQITQTTDRLLGREQELLPQARDQRKRRLMRSQLRQRVLTLLGDGWPGTGLAAGVLAGLLGESALPDAPALVPVADAMALCSMLQSAFAVPAISAELMVHPDVLVPRSQPTIQLMCDAIRQAATRLPVKAQILDMGCGSGVLTVAAAQILRHLQPQVAATDILPEALATTRLNVERLGRQGRIDASCVRVGHGGDLFQPLGDQIFDLIMFNAPWVVAPAHNRAELALNDAGQQTMERFLHSASQHLRPGGSVIVGYADNSGPTAITRLESLMATAGLEVTAVLKDRIKTHRAARPWQNIYAYLLRRQV